MKIKYDADISNQAIAANLKRLINLVFKLLPNWEENIDWKKPLETILEELAGMDELLTDYHKQLFAIMCKLEGLMQCTEDDFALFRRTIFETLAMLGEMRQAICQD